MTGGGSDTGGSEPFGNMARQGMERERLAGRWEYAATTMPNASRRRLDQPAPTLAFGNDAASAVFLPVGADARAAKADGRARRITVEEAAILQTFPADHPWRGVTTKRYQQVGNAVPPLLAKAVLAEVLR
jgi:DNA (cytosine-5)-methyltransferase 1